jgi:hypothetical protein
LQIMHQEANQPEYMVCQSWFWKLQI